MEDLNKPRRNIPPLSELGFGLWEFFSQKSSSTFEKVRELKESRWRLKEREFTLLSEVVAAVAALMMKS